MSTQELEQRVCQRYGWSARFFRTPGTADDNIGTATASGFWAVEVRKGILDEPIVFVSTNNSTNQKDGRKAASIVALESLRDAIEQEEGKPTVAGLDEAVGHLFHAKVVSSDEAWKNFWRNPPSVVGVDAEGNHICPPVLVQVATDDVVILEAPIRRLSKHLRRLLSDDRITKVFCDNGSHRDKTSLSLSVPSDMTSGAVVDLEVLATDRLGPVKSPRGIGKLLTLVMPELGVRIVKESGRKRLKDIGTFAAIEQGLRKPLQGVHELSNEEQRYAALDAWCTLQIWKRLQD